jgi:hypothetical protein
MSRIPKRSITDSPDASGVVNIEHNLPSGAKKVLPLIGYLEYIGDASAQKEVAAGELIALFNNSATVGFLKMALAGATIASAPSAAGPDIIHLKPNDYTIISLGPNAVFRSSANITAYRLVDASILSKE